MIWAARLAFYLLRRILTIKVDHRFDGRWEDPVKFARFWILQALSTAIIMLPVILIASTSPKGFSLLHLLGALVWVLGLSIEAIADEQKFRLKKKQSASFIKSGLCS